MIRPLLVSMVVALSAPFGSTRADPQTDRVVHAFESSASLKVRSQAALVLGQLGSPEAGPALRRAAQADPAAAVRIAALAALAKLGREEAVPVLEGAERTDPDPAVRAAAAAALAELSDARPAPAPAVRGGQAVSLEAAVGEAGGPADRLALNDALGRRLTEAGFQVQDAGGIRLKPSIVRLEVERAGERTRIAVRAELVAVEGSGRMAAMLQGGARLSATGALADRDLAAFSARAVDAVAKELVDDLAVRLGER